MKRNILIIFIAIISGIVLTGLFYIKVNTILKETDQKLLTVFQIGVYKNKINALSEAKKYGGIVHKDDNYYRVYIAAYQNDEIISKMENYYHNNSVSYHLRKIKVDEEYLSIINKYEKLLMNSNDHSIYENLNNLLVTKLEEHL